VPMILVFMSIFRVPTSRVIQQLSNQSCTTPYLKLPSVRGVIAFCDIYQVSRHTTDAEVGMIIGMRAWTTQFFLSVLFIYLINRPPLHEFPQPDSTTSYTFFPAQFLTFNFIMAKGRVCLAYSGMSSAIEYQIRYQLITPSFSPTIC
jgi:hypothetical protein